MSRDTRSSWSGRGSGSGIPCNTESPIKPFVSGYWEWDESGCVAVAPPAAVPPDAEPDAIAPDDPEYDDEDATTGGAVAGRNTA